MSQHKCVGFTLFGHVNVLQCSEWSQNDSNLRSVARITPVRKLANFLTHCCHKESSHARIVSYGCSATFVPRPGCLAASSKRWAIVPPFSARYFWTALFEGI